MSILDKILGGPVAALAEIFKRRMEIKAEARAQERQIKAALAERQVELIKQGLTADMNWEMEFAKQASSSWKDEFVLLVLSVPLVLCFVPSLTPYARAGFEALAQTPDWYRWLVTVIFCAIYGIRIWRRTQSDT